MWFVSMSEATVLVVDLPKVLAASTFTGTLLDFGNVALRQRVLVNIGIERQVQSDFKLSDVVLCIVIALSNLVIFRISYDKVM